VSVRVLVVDVLHWLEVLVQVEDNNFTISEEQGHKLAYLIKLDVHYLRLEGHRLVDDFQLFHVDNPYKAGFETYRCHFVNITGNYSSRRVLLTGVEFMNKCHTFSLPDFN
jgi:hypothetical protein